MAFMNKKQQIVGLPVSPGAGALPVGNADGSWTSGINGDPKGNSFAAEAGVSGASLTGGAVIASAGGNTCQMEETGIVTINAQEVDLKAIPEYASPEDPLATMSDLGTPGGAFVDPCAIKPQGRLWVPPAYMQTTGDAAVQLKVTGGIPSLAAFVWLQEITCAISYLSAYVKTVTVPGRMDVLIYEKNDLLAHVSNSENATLLGSGYIANIATTGWKRFYVPEPTPPYGAHVFQHGREYVALFVCENFGDAADISLSCRRWNTSCGSMIPDGCSSLICSDGSTVIPLTQDSKPAMLNVVLGSTTNHSPALIYGRYNGKYLSLFDGAAWQLREIPIEGIWNQAENNPVGCYNVFVSYTDGVGWNMALDYTEAEGVGLQDGIEVAPDEPRARLVGGFSAIERQTGLQAPIDVPDWRGVDNLHNRKPRKIAKFCPYAGNTDETITGNTQWRPWQNSTSFRINFYCCKATELRVLASTLGISCDVAVQVDAVTELHPHSSAAATGNLSMHFHVKSLETTLTPGLHYIVPMVQSISTSATGYLLYHKDTAVTGGGTDYSVRAQLHGDLS
jgi:hypothetical protein